MVILEAKVLGLPIVSTAFSSVDGALSAGEGVITSLDAEGLAAGMIQARQGNAPRVRYDVEAYDADVLRQFDEVVLGGGFVEAMDSRRSLGGAT